MGNIISGNYFHHITGPEELGANAVYLDDLAGGFKVAGEACNGLEAIQQVNQLHPDVVLMDLVMPQIDGLEATERIKDQHPETGVVMISIHDDEETRKQATEAGVDAFLAKGTDTETLIQTIQEVGDKRREGR